MRLPLLSARCSNCLLGFFFAFSVTGQLHAQSPGCTLRIHVDGFRSTRGVAGILLFTSPAGWPEDVRHSYEHKAEPIQTASHDAHITFDNLPPGNYGVVALHDENRNMKLDRNLVGWPKEGFGFSNNPHVGLSAPSFQQAQLPVRCPATDTDIHIQYK